MAKPLVIYTTGSTNLWYYDDEDGTSGPFVSAQDLFSELKRLGKVQDSCPTCQEE